MRTVHFVFAVAIALSACAPPRFNETTGRFEGPQSARIADIHQNYVDEKPYDHAAVETRPDGSRVLRTELSVEVMASATVGQVQSAFDAVGARVNATLDGRAIMGLRIPDPGTLPALEGVVQKLKNSPGIAGVSMSVFAEVE